MERDHAFEERTPAGSRPTSRELAVGGLPAVSRVIDAVDQRFGRTAASLILAAVVISTGNAVIRIMFDTSLIAWLKARWYLFGAVCMLYASWTLLAKEHIRIDIMHNPLKAHI
jgi:TRAP-type mannitol/chloroaromatic compound transport system permease small subunit